MNVTFACPRCEQPARLELDMAAPAFACPHCKSAFAIPAGEDAGGDDAGGHLKRCLVCPSRDLYLRKDFPQRLGVLIVVLGFAASTVTWAFSRPIWTYAILFATALVDVVLYLVMPSALMCYHCGAQYRNLPTSDGYAGFDLETHERYRQQAIRVAEQNRRVAAGSTGHGQGGWQRAASQQPTVAESAE